MSVSKKKLYYCTVLRDCCSYWDNGTCAYRDGKKDFDAMCGAPSIISDPDFAKASLNSLAIIKRQQDKILEELQKLKQNGR